MSFVNYKSDWRSNAAQVEAWARNSQEALAWWEEAALAGGIESKPYDYSVSYNGHEFFLHANTYFHEEGHQKSALVIGDDLAAAGAEFYFETPCVQLYKEGERVAGAIGQNADGGYVLLKAAKGVILATGDYVGDTEMLEYYTPDAKGLHQAVDFRNGSGLKAGMWAGAQMCPASHTKMVHGESAAVRFEMPYLFLDRHGNRFMDEGCCRMGYLNEFTKKYLKEVDFADSTAAKFFSIVPMNWEEHYEQWKDFSDISIHNAYRNVDPEQWIKADTLEDLAEAMIAYANEQKWAHELDAAAIVESINRYNELVAKGSDDDFGKRSEYLVPIEAPCYGRATRREQHRLPGGRPRGGRQLPVPRRGNEPHRRAVRRRQRVGPVLRRRQLSHGHRGPVGGSRHHHRLCDRPLRGEPLEPFRSFGLFPWAAAAVRRRALPSLAKAGVPCGMPAFAFAPLAACRLASPLPCGAVAGRKCPWPSRPSFVFVLACYNPWGKKGVSWHHRRACRQGIGQGKNAVRFSRARVATWWRMAAPAHGPRSRSRARGSFCQWASIPTSRSMPRMWP